MGAKDSKPSFISYEDAVKRVSDSELRRIKEAFKRCAGANGTALSLEAFVHEVLCDGVPYEVAEWLYQACGGTKRGIAFKELLCGIVVLTKGNIEEKIKFLWTLYTNNQGDNGTYIYKRDFARTLHLENTSLPVTGAQRSAEILLGLFGTGEKVTFEQFRSWLLIHKDATVLSKWLLSESANAVQDLETPTFYQSLAGVTHLEERDIIELEKCFWSLRTGAATGQLDAASLAPLLAPLPRAAVTGVFLALDENRDGHVDFKELCCGLSAACRGPTTERLKFCFKIFDLDRDGVLNKKELIDMVGILCTVANEDLKDQGSRASTPSDEEDSDGTDKGFDPEVILMNLREKLIVVPKNGTKPVFQLGPNPGEMEETPKEESSESDEGLIGGDMALPLEEFLIWSVECAGALVTPFLQRVVQVSHVALGLRPHCRHQERDIVLGWLRREVSRGYRVGQFWYLVAAEWWGAWGAYTAAGAEGCCRPSAPAPSVPPALSPLAPSPEPKHRHIDEAIVCDESFTTNSTESMGSLLWRAETASLASASSSGVSSGRHQLQHQLPPHPGPIRNTRLLAPNLLKVRTLTGEGGHLRRDVTLAQHRDFALVPDALWRALALWYSAPDPLPRQVIRPPNSDVELELYPLHLKILRHVPNTQRSVGSAGSVGSTGGAVLYPAAPAPPERQLAYTAAFSRLATVKQVAEFICGSLGLAREDVRLWALGAGLGVGTGVNLGAGAGASPGAGAGAVLLDDERPTLQELRLDERTRLLVEVRNPDLTWPEEIGALGGGSRATERRQTLSAPSVPGATGLHNLGNTCYMNAALQSVWNTGPLTRYFNSGTHLHEVNRTNPLGTGGALALRYGELCKEVWSCSARSVAPLRVRWCVSRHARALAGGGQHDAQELLAWLLDALHEDLNRAAVPAPASASASAPAPTPAPSAAPPATRPDQELAAEAWEQYTARNRSIMTELFYGQLKSKVRCDTCGAESVRFDTFNMLSLPLPMESYVTCQIRVMLLDGSVPIKYGVRVNSEGTYLELKKGLSELCGLAPESMMIVELSESIIGRVLEDGSRVTGNVTELFAYELPADLTQDCSLAPDSSDEDEHVHTNGWDEAAGGAYARAEVSGRGASLCMPALFCFKRSRSEILMSQSPPSTFHHNAAVFTDTPNCRSNTLPKELKNHSTCSPTLSVKSLNIKPSSPRLGKIKFGSSPSNMYRMNEIPSQLPPGKITYLVAVHRKSCRSESYFLGRARSKPVPFGVPLVVGVRDGASGRDVYARVWAMVARLLTRRPPAHHAQVHAHNHATDCDDSLGYEFPFTLRAVGGGNGNGGGAGGGAAWCAVCAWPAMCRGCALPADDTPLIFGCSGKRSRSRTQYASRESDVPEGESPRSDTELHRRPSTRLSYDSQGSCGGGGGPLRRLEVGKARGRLMLAIDWDPTALHLRYQSTREKECVEHASVAAGAAAARRAVDLASCLRAFTGAERLEQRYHCAACRSKQPATKKLQIWRAPPVMIIHLKRFQYVNNKWIKSQKVVNFPFEDFDPTPYLASVPQETILRHMEIKNKQRSSVFVDDPISESDSEDDDAKDVTKPKPKLDRRRKSSVEVRRQRLESTSLVTTPVTDDNLVDYHQHHLLKDQDPFDLKYKLYAVVSHSGQLSGGHYVAYARNPSGAWLCYNDSSCRELPRAPLAAPLAEPLAAPLDPPLDPAAAYLLFYQRRGLHYDKYLPTVPAEPPPTPTLDDGDPDLKNMCVIA